MFFYLKPGAIYNDTELYAVCVLLPNKMDLGQHVHIIKTYGEEEKAAAFCNYLHGGNGR